MKSVLDTSQLLLQLQRIPLTRLRQALELVLVLCLGWLLAKVTWQLLPETQTGSGLVVINQQAAATEPVGVSLAALVAPKLFGTASAQTVKTVEPVVTEAPKTSLNVKLTGVVALASDPGAGSAIIESRGSEATYAVDDQIDGTNARLKQVLADRVLIQQAGRFETLMLDGIEYTKIAQANAGLGRADEPASEMDGDMAPVPEPMEMQPLQASEQLDARRDELIAEPMKFFDYIRVSPQRNNGQLSGYRLMPGKDPSLFAQLGLQPNDLAIEINGIALNDMQQAMNVINELRDAKEAAIKIERDGEIRDILVSLSQ
ncbi:MAG: type II secretion system protein GspC [Gammaproteobacteria bacterium]|nr:type II secretion system protein GspC [Gammaproteobacteria bacterium]MBU1555503.1 type II secretion system protein GspC [Gammaproteobacteria bacterium]MBU2069484.1 type II secretion system protein GspC [Gammaproteobacteria bacterium]MBU2182988.1 type II secretion system protein GspC [Gammaproteobacteria bacterium]MBU2203232.1 type II secretion system protein GspC [Gammaproteobacteria bacterium]